MQVSKIYGSHGDSEREANTDRKLERERERWSEQRAVYSDALTRFYVPPPGRYGMHIVAVVRLILEAVTWLVNARKRFK